MSWRLVAQTTSFSTHIAYRVLPQSTVGVLSLTYLHATVWAVI